MKGITEAVGVASPFWPLPAVTRKRFTFGWGRRKGLRHHAGVDLYAPRGSPVVAPEAGTLIRWHRFVGPHSVALLMQTDTGIVILFGEVEPRSWEKHGLKIGSRVRAGQTVAEVGINNDKSQMLHFETYVKGTRSNRRWYKGKPPPPALLDPTLYLRTAEALDGTQGDDDGDDVDDGGSNDDDINDDQGDDDVKPDIAIPDTGDIIPNSGGVGLFALALVLLADWSQRR